MPFVLSCSVVSFDRIEFKNKKLKGIELVTNVQDGLSKMILEAVV